jgi:hypothetical protein
MPKINKETREMRIKEVPITTRRRIAAYQKIVSAREEREVSVDEACIDLWEKALANIPAFQS